MRPRPRLTPLRAIAVAALLFVLGPTYAPAASPPRDSILIESLHAAAPELDARVLGLALEARACAVAQGLVEHASRLAVIDYSRPSTQSRLWVFDLSRSALLFTEHVAHGQETGGDLARHFSNDAGSHQSSLGLFRTAETYVGGNGYSLRMDGLEPGFNDRARERAIVMHGAWYADPELARRQGRLGRSQGCPAVRTAIARPLIDSLKDGQLLFAYYPDRHWLGSSRVLGCGRGSAVADRRAAASP